MSGFVTVGPWSPRSYIWKSGFGPNGSLEEKSKTVLPASMLCGSWVARDEVASQPPSHPCSVFC